MGAPFDDWKTNEVEVPEGMITICAYYAWLYQLYMFYIISLEIFGSEIADKVVEIQDAEVKNVLDTNLFNIKKSITDIHQAVIRLLENPEFDNMEENSSLPLEYSMAKEFVYSGKYDPFKFTEEHFDSGQIAILGLCLLHCKESAVANFSKILNDIANSIVA